MRILMDFVSSFAVLAPVTVVGTGNTVALRCGL
jgi:hypothetical protein